MWVCQACGRTNPATLHGQAVKCFSCGAVFVPAEGETIVPMNDDDLLEGMGKMCAEGLMGAAQEILRTCLVVEEGTSKDRLAEARAVLAEVGEYVLRRMIESMDKAEMPDWEVSFQDMYPAPLVDFATVAGVVLPSRASWERSGHCLFLSGQGTERSWHHADSAGFCLSLPYTHRLIVEAVMKASDRAEKLASVLEDCAERVKGIAIVANAL